VSGRDAGGGFHRSRTPRDAAEAAAWEVEHHLAELVDHLVAEGMPSEEARREAERRFGDPRGYRARLERDERRRRTAMRRTEMWGLVKTSVGSTARTLRRSPGFALGVILTLALGIGANATMFGVLDRLLFSPPAHIVDANAVRRVIVERSFMGRPTRSETMAYPDYLDLKAASAFQDVAAWSGPARYTLGGGPDATRVRATLATWGFFPLLGVHPVLGRFYSEEDDRAEAESTVVLGYEFWKRAYGADPGVLGRTLVVSGHPFTIVGVAPEGFTGVDLQPVDLWLPLVNAGVVLNGPQWRDSRGWYWMSAVARLAPGVDPARAAEEATALHLNGREKQIEEGHYEKDARLALDPLIAARGPEASGEAKVARWLGGVSLLVLLIACANVANLFLARGTRRRREVAVRLALGVGRGRLIGSMVVESVVLAALGGAVAVLLSYWGGGALRTALLPGVLFPGAAVGGRVVAFTLATAVLAGLLAGVGPAVQGTRADLSGDLAMGAGASSGRRSRTRAVLTVLQAALSVVLLVGAGLFVRSVGEVRGLDLGLDKDRLALATLEFGTTGIFPSMQSDSVTTDADRNAVYDEAMRRVAALPEVQDVAGTNSPFQWAFADELKVPGFDSLPQLPGGGPYFQDVTPTYLRTVGLRITRGRDLQESDDAGAAPVAVVSETMARTLWPDDDPLGKCLMVGEDPKTCTTVVGVAEDASRGELQEEPYMTYYMPLAQHQDQRMNALYIRTSGDPARAAAAVAPLLRGFDPRVRFATVRPLREILEPQARAWTLGATMFTAFGLLAVLVAAIGLYGVLAFDVAQRTRELGIRTALGAERRRLLGDVVSRGLRLGGAGVLLGLVVALAVGPYAAGLLFQVSPRDPLVLGGVALLLLGVAAAASLLPGLRATRVDASEALRAE